jgi:hypothetical protein
MKHETAKHVRTLYNILGKTYKNWKRGDSDSLFGFSYLAASPRTDSDVFRSSIGHTILQLSPVARISISLSKHDTLPTLGKAQVQNGGHQLVLNENLNFALHQPHQ